MRAIDIKYCTRIILVLCGIFGDEKTKLRLYFGMGIQIMLTTIL